MNKYLKLIKEQNRAIASLRHMMERGYFIIFLADRNQFGTPLRTGRWALCKYPVPKDKDKGIVLFDNYEDVYQKATFLVWVDHDLRKNCDTIYALESLDSLVRKVIIQE